MVVIPFHTEHFANWSRKSSCAGSQHYRAVLGIALEAREAERLFVFFWVGSQRSCPILGGPVFGEGERQSVCFKVLLAEGNHEFNLRMMGGVTQRR